MSNPKDIEALKRLRDYHWHAFRWHLDENRQYASELHHAISKAYQSAIDVLMGDKPEMPKLPGKYDNIPYGEWPKDE